MRNKAATVDDAQTEKETDQPRTKNEKVTDTEIKY
jgi:hypothetical protein